MRFGHGTYGWIKATQQEIQSQGLGRVAGGLGTMSSFRAEAQGVASLLAHSLDEEIQGAILHLGNKGVVGSMQQTRLIHPLQPEWDLLEVSRKRLHQRKVQTYHVKGHQTPRPSAPREVHLNNQADKLTMEAHKDQNVFRSTPAGFGAMLYIAGHPITGKYGGATHHTTTTLEISVYYQKNTAGQMRTWIPSTGTCLGVPKLGLWSPKKEHSQMCA